MGISNNAATLLAAASVIALSVGMEPALADSQNNNGVLIGLSKQDKGDANQLKLHSQQYKEHSSQLKLDSNHIKMDSQQYKQNSSQLKLDSHQVKGGSMQQKGNPHALNPQPEPPG